MAEMRVKSLHVGQIRTNCYVAYNTESKEAFIVDPGDDAMRIRQFITEMSLQPVAILLTHGHFDHIMAVETLRDTYQIPVYAHEDEADITVSSGLNLSTAFGCPMSLEVDRLVADQQEIVIAGFKIQVIHTPGHTAGGACYYLPEEQVLFSGDTLFAQSIGRTDFPTGSHSTLVRSIKEKLFDLPDGTQVYPGHEESTSIAIEKMYNPFI